MRHRRIRTLGGAGLVEVIVATALIAAVLISAAGMIVRGRHAIGGAKRATLALAIARDVVEEMAGWSFARTYTAFGCDPAAVVCAVEPGLPPADGWAFRKEDTLPGSRVEIVIEPIDGAALVRTSSIRLSVTVRWADGPRRRLVRLVTVRS